MSLSNNDFQKQDLNFDINKLRVACDQVLKIKVEQAFANNLAVIFCCGETLEQRESGVHFDWIKSQLIESIFHLSATDFTNIDIISAGPIPPNPSELLGNKTMEGLIAELKEMYDIIVIDEASMISKELVHELIMISSKIKGKIIFMKITFLFLIMLFHQTI